MPSADVTTTSAQIIAPGNRRVAMLQNLSDTDIYVRFTGSEVTTGDGANSGLKLPANGGMIALPDLPANERFGTQQTENDNGIYAIHAGTGIKKLRYEIL